MKSALITGITGQDGAYLAELLLAKDYQVYGTYRRTSTVLFWRLDELGITKHPNLQLVAFDLTDLSAAIRLIEKFQPDEIYNLAGQSFVGVAFEQPITTAEITGIGPVCLLEAIRIVNPSIKFYQASTSEIFGKVQSYPQNEDTNFQPRNPYGIAKLYAHWMTINYRESYNMFATAGILYNHESPLRGKEFVTRKITDSAASIKLGLVDSVELGNLDAQRDWGFAAEYVEGIYLMLQAERPETYVLATNRTETVRSFVSHAFQAVDISIEWQGCGIDEIGIDTSSGREIVKVNPKFFRPSEKDRLIGDASKAKAELGWQAKVSLEELCRIMVEADLRRNRLGASF